MSTETKTYNGWTNYETWNVALWMGNERGSSSYWDEAALEAWDEAEEHTSHNMRLEEATYKLSERLKDEHETMMQDMLRSAGQQASMWADMLGAALSEVDWYEIGGNLLDNNI